MVKGTKVSKVSSGEANLNETQRAWWTEIKDIDIELYGLPDQKIGQIASPINMEPDKLHLTTKAPAGITAIEAGLQKHSEIDADTRIRYPKFSMAVEDKYIVVKPMEGQIVKGPNGKPVFVPKK